MPQTTPLSPTRQAVKDYAEKGLSAREIAQLLGISTQRVYVHLHRLELPVPTQKEKAS